MAARKYKYDLVEVMWDDAAVENAWTSLPLKMEKQIVYSAGFLVVDTPDHIVISCTYSDDLSEKRTDITGFIQIPRGMVLDMKVIRKASKPSREKVPESKDNAS